MAREVVPGIWELRVPIPNNPLGYLLSYLIKGEDGFILVDAGWPSTQAFNSVREAFRELSVSPGDVRAIVLTHGHIDHFGLAGRLRELTGARLLMHRKEFEGLQGQHGPPGGSPETREKWLRENGVPEVEIRRLGHPPAHPEFLVKPDVLIEEGPIQEAGVRLEAIWTPGHAPGHICLYKRERRIFFSGDHVLPVITPHVSYRPASEDSHAGEEANPLADFVASLTKVEGLAVDLVLPAHEHSFQDLRGRVEAIKAHHEARLGAVVKAASGQNKTPYEIASLVPWDVGPWRKMPVWQRISALTECLAHLEYLVPEQRLTREFRDGLTYFQPVS